MAVNSLADTYEVWTDILERPRVVEYVADTYDPSDSVKMRVRLPYLITSGLMIII